MKLPTNFMGISTEEAYKKYLEGLRKPKKPRTRNPATTTIQGVNLTDYVFMPEHNLYIAKNRSHQNNNWYDSHKAAHQEGARMLTIREFVDFLNLLRSGNVPDGQNNRLQEREIEGIYKNIVEVRNPYRAEWLDADFKVKDGVLHTNYNHRTIDDELKPQNSELLEDCLMETKTPGIDLEYWLRNSTRQGLPPRNNPDGSLYYWEPLDDNNSVAGFLAYSVRAYLGCDWGPSDSDAELGVRFAREKN